MGLYKQAKSKLRWFEFVAQGVRHRGSAGTEVRRDALAYERRARVAADAAPIQKASAQTLAHAASLDVNRAVAKGVVSGALSALQGHWRNLAAIFNADAGLDTISAAQVTAYVLQRRRKVRGQTIVREMAALKRGYTLCALPHPVPWPTVRSDKPRPGQAGKLHSAATILAFLAELSTRLRDEALFCALTGLRSAELKRVRPEWSHKAP